MTLFANPTFIAANGEVSVISALVIEPAGTPVPDGTVGPVLHEPRDDRGPGQDQRRRGAGEPASRTRARARPTVTAISGAEHRARTDASTIGSGRPGAARHRRRADPPRITRPDDATSRGRAGSWPTSSTATGNPVRNVPVFFTIGRRTPATETLASGGRRSSPTPTARRSTSCRRSYPPKEVAEDRDGHARRRPTTSPSSRHGDDQLMRQALARRRRCSAWRRARGPRSPCSRTA